ncbi:hypothetical protein ABEG63_12805 [Chryseobacterium sp. C39-AII1]|uniref:hypothetical protein n=1 Tax=Chryseobacterium sp. C39-AII1 TaxID=3080332 RepID=UPI00320B600C
MKKLFLSLFLTSTLGLYAQGTINIFNYTNYRLSNDLVGSNQASNCYPSISGTNYPIMVQPGASVSYTGYATSHLQNPPINSWNVQLSASSSPTIQPAGAPILNTLAAITKWQMTKFYVEDPSGAPIPVNSGMLGNIDCTTMVTELQPSATTPYTFSGFWFEIGNETYFIIQ